MEQPFRRNLSTRLCVNISERGVSSESMWGGGGYGGKRSVGILLKGSSNMGGAQHSSDAEGSMATLSYTVGKPTCK